MKKLFSLLAMCLVSLGMMAQAQLTATLTHEGNTTSYEGTNAFEDALKVAADGDLITLSAGTFVTRSEIFVLNKQLTIRGNGMEGSEATFIDSPVQINKNDNDVLGLKIEGINFKQSFNVGGQPDHAVPYVVEGVTLLKCKLNEIGSNPTKSGRYGAEEHHGTFKNLALVQCKCAGPLKLYNEASASIINSVLAKPFTTGRSDYNGFIANVSVTFDHSIYLAASRPNDLTPATFKNSIVTVQYDDTYMASTYVPIHSACSFENCIVTGTIRTPQYLFNKCQNANTEYFPTTDVFKTCTNVSSLIDDTYELTDAAKAILATDGTEIGIYGGAAPYSSVVSYPRFTTFEVADKAVDGKLSVTIATE